MIVTTGKDVGKVTITAGGPVKQQELLYITDGEPEAEQPSLTKGTEYMVSMKCFQTFQQLI